jgi:hypothetical protein
MSMIWDTDHEKEFWLLEGPYIMDLWCPCSISNKKNSNYLFTPPVLLPYIIIS